MLRHSLVREISIVLAFKVVALSALYLLFFSAETRPDVTVDTVSRSLLTAPAASQGE